MNFGRTYLGILATRNAIAEAIAFVSGPARWLAWLRRLGGGSSVRHARGKGLSVGRRGPHRPEAGKANKSPTGT